MMDLRSLSLPRTTDSPGVMLRRIAAVLACAMLLGCDNPLSARESQQLAEAEILWKKQNLDDYIFEMRTSCFCGGEVTEWAVVEVRDDAVYSAHSLTGAPLTGLALTSRKTVGELFELAHHYRPDWVADIDFEFDPVLGYPVRLSFDSKPNIADAGTTYEARNLRAVAPL
jgi:uncharacterized protein DUF6174